MTLKGIVDFILTQGGYFLIWWLFIWDCETL
ncbi:Uncharacterised protein [Enterococcus gallinarum]|uniref:Uncharacterized protein n=1 Tax=Enterococcus gallinarum TaxID=1353 RepID=A0A376GV94_ENTGA|nr:Uncharacterised protein [Enterococcus gallinarum]